MMEPIIPPEILKLRKKFKHVKFKALPPQEHFVGFRNAIVVFQGEEMVFRADAARLISADASCECTSLLEVEYIRECLFACTFCNPVVG